MPSLDVNGTTLHYTDDGPRDAPALVLSHSLFFDHVMFDAQVEAFAGEYRVVRYDHRGQGASARAPREELDMDTLTADAAALIEALDLTTVTFLGNSLGGFVALRLAARRAIPHSRGAGRVERDGGASFAPLNGTMSHRPPRGRFERRRLCRPIAVAPP